MTNFNGIAEFVATVEFKSFVLAAQHIGMTSSGVSKAVSRLEQRLGVTLLNRSTRRLSLTASGAVFYQRCRQILVALRDAESVVSGSAERPRGTLRLDLTPLFGRLYVMPALPAFTGEYPDLVVEAVFRRDTVDLFDQGIDAAVRIGTVSGSAVANRKIGVSRHVTCASAAYLERHGVPERPEDLLHHNCVNFLSPQTGKPQHWHFADGPMSFTLPVDGNLALGYSEGLLDAVIKGVGIAQLPDYMAVGAVKEGLVHPILKSWIDRPRPICVITPADRPVPLKVSAFISFVSGVVPDVCGLR